MNIGNLSNAPSSKQFANQKAVPLIKGVHDPFVDSKLIPNKKNQPNISLQQQVEESVQLSLSMQ